MRFVVTEDSIHLRKKRTKAQPAVKPFCFFNFYSNLCGCGKCEITSKLYVENQKDLPGWTDERWA